VALAQGRPATNKLSKMKDILAILKNKALHGYLLREPSRILEHLANWLEPTEQGASPASYYSSPESSLVVWLNAGSAI
jgi:hypothetical protein